MNTTDEYERQFARISSANPVKISSKLVKSTEQIAVDEYKEELKAKINQVINKFGKDTDVDGRQILYKFTNADLRYLKEDLLRLLE